MTAERKTRALVGPLVTLTEPQIERVLAVLREKTVEEGDCLIWTAAMSKTVGGRRPQPVVWLDGEVRPVRRLAYVAHGHELFAHWRVCTDCGDYRCVADAHLCRKSHSASLLGHPKSAVTAARIAAAKQAASPLNWDLVRAIRASDRSNQSLAAEMGVNPDTIGQVRRHVTWREIASPFAGLGARS